MHVVSKVDFTQRKPLRVFHYYLCTRYARRWDIKLKENHFQPLNLCPQDGRGD